MILKHYSYPALFLALFLITSCKTARLQKNTASEHIEQLKNGVLLVRLRTQEAKVEALKEVQKVTLAEEIQKKQEAQNERIITAFDQYFDFCPVFFFYAKDSKLIKDRSFEGIIFDAKKENISNTTLENKAFYIADFGNIEEPGVVTQLEGLSIRDSSFQQLQSPFPYAVSVNSFLAGENVEERTVQAFNAKLESYHISAQYRRQKQELKRAKRALSSPK